MESSWNHEIKLFDIKEWEISSVLDNKDRNCWYVLFACIHGHSQNKNFAQYDLKTFNKVDGAGGGGGTQFFCDFASLAVCKL